MSDKSLEILSATGGSLETLCGKILEQVDRTKTVLGIVFFISATRTGEYESSLRTLREVCGDFFGEASSLLTCVAQKPLGSDLAAEVLYLDGDGTVERKGDFLIIRSGGTTELLSEGIRFPEAGDTGEQAVAIFGRIGDMLESEGFGINGIVRQWNYIEGITAVSDGIQNYQLFNDARSSFYAMTEWPGGYPAATGIGSSTGGVIVSIYAVKGAERLSRPIDNPIQVPAHSYSGRVLRSGRQENRTTPKFERARLLGDTVFVSGTAAIKGEDSEISSDPHLQSKAAIDVMDHLVSPGNIFPGCSHFHFEALRVYIKHEDDAPAIMEEFWERWGDVPTHFLKADICRPELLLELEGIGSVRRFLECCCTDAGEAVEAQAGGAGRIELCEDLPCGGVTPSRENIIEVLSKVNIPVNVLVRPRGGDFVYNEEEVLRMEASIALCKKLGVNGVVIGALKKDGSVDMEVMRRLIAAAEGLQITFHRAFDECSDPFKALEDIISLGCGRLLTAGHASNVNDGAPTLKNLNKRAAGRIIIMAGSGVRPGNIASLDRLTAVREFHSSSHGPDGRTSRAVVSSLCGRQ